MYAYDPDNKIQKCSNLDYQDLSVGCISDDLATSKFTMEETYQIQMILMNH